MRALHIGVQAWGSEGDIRPLLALGHGLAQRGHRVDMVVTSVDGHDYRERGHALGVSVEHVGQEQIAEQASQIREMAMRIVRSRDMLWQVGQVLKFMYEPAREEMYRAGCLLAERCDLVVGHFLLDATKLAAQQNGCPHVSIATIPITASRTFPPLGFPDLGPWLNLAMWRVGGFAFHVWSGRAINRFRAEHGAEKVKCVLPAAYESDLLHIVATSPELCPRPVDWPATHKVSGWLRLPDSAGTVSDEVERFLQAGPPPIYVTFGSMLTVDLDPSRLEESAQLLLETVELCGCRAIIQFPWTRLPERAPDENVLRVEHAHHSMIFPRCSLIVHHGGAGTTQTTVCAGRPSVVVPHAVDQAGWGAVLAKRGLAPKPLRRSAVSPKKLARRITTVLQDPTFEETAKQVGERLRAERGVENAVGWIEEVCRS